MCIRDRVYTEVFHIKNTYWALLIPGLLMNAFNVMLARNFFSNSIPKPLIEAALIDGATEFQVFRRIVIPISLPIIATLGMFIFMAYWNCLLYTSTAEIPVAFRKFRREIHFFMIVLLLMYLPTPFLSLIHISYCKP